MLIQYEIFGPKNKKKSLNNAIKTPIIKILKEVLKNKINP
jgi:hypothetical protein